VAGAQESVEVEVGDPEQALRSSPIRIEGRYGCVTIAHGCLESHGTVCEWDRDGRLTVWCSTQNVSLLPGQFAEALSVPADRVRVLCEFMGGGFGSKFSPDSWGILCAELARELGAPVRLVLDRSEELAVAGSRPSTWAEVRAAATADGKITAWESKSWGTGGPQGTGSPPIPYLFEIPNRRHRHVSVPTHTGPVRAWRAPNHPQACFVTMAALDDLAAAVRMNPLDFFLRNAELLGRRAGLYREQLEIASRLMDWKAKWRPRGQGASGPVRRGVGLSLHTWGGRGHRSRCEVELHPDGTVLARIGTQDLGTGTRTVVGMVLAETLGLPLEAVRVEIGDSRFPSSGASGGSTTAGGVASATRRAAVNAREAFLRAVAVAVGVPPESLAIRAGRVEIPGAARPALSWKEASAKLGVTPVLAAGENPGEGELTSGGVGGVQMAEVAVDIETGVVRVVKMVAVQDCGLVVNLKTAESQVYGGMIMGISYALYEEKIHDPVTGRLLDANLDGYKLPTLADVGELVVHLMTGPEQDARGVIGLGEPPVISPGAAISNAVANAIGVRVPQLPMTPDRVLEALGRTRRA
jgi:xanthine dehydrogenase YagR molybdenum-binding subunit